MPEAALADTSSEETKPNTVPCRWCGAPMTVGYPLCRECKNFTNWRRLFSISTPVLGLFVALVSVLGVNVSGIAAVLVPPRASFLVSANLKPDATLEIVATNVGNAFGYVDRTLDCFADDMVLSFEADAPLAVGAKATTTMSMRGVSTFWTVLLRDLAAEPTDEMLLPDSWDCRISTLDAHGDVTAKFDRKVLKLVLIDGKLTGFFAET